MTTPGRRRFHLEPFHTRLSMGVALGLAVALWPSAWRFAAPALSPYLAIGSALALRALPLSVCLALPMLAAVLLRRRFWCRNLCPVGLISESCGKARARRAPGRVLPFGPALARFLALTTLGGAVLGYPLFLWMDPLALFSGFFSVARIHRSGASPLSVAGLPAVILISFLLPGAWCSRICPLGGLQDLLSMLLRRRRRARSSPARHRPGPLLPARRNMVAFGIGTVFAAAAPKAWAGRLRHLRPPGNVDETAFQGACIRCGSCSRVCPSGIIEPAGGAADAAGFLVPRLRFSGMNYCLQDCNRCGMACPTGVIRALPLEAKNRHVIGIAAIDLSACLLATDVECGVCLPRCPRGAIEEVFVRETYKTSLRVLAEKCNGCGACVGICPPKVVRVVAHGT